MTTDTEAQRSHATETAVLLTQRSHATETAMLLMEDGATPQRQLNVAVLLYPKALLFLPEVIFLLTTFYVMSLRYTLLLSVALQTFIFPLIKLPS